LDITIEDANDDMFFRCPNSIGANNKK